VKVSEAVAFVFERERARREVVVGMGRRSCQRTREGRRSGEEQEGRKDER